MKKYNLGQIMRRAWEIKKSGTDYIFSICLRVSWAEARKEPKMTINQMIERFMIRRQGEYIVASGSSGYTPEDARMIRQCKPEIFAELIRREEAELRERQERQEKIDAIAGLKEIREAEYAWNEWNYHFNREMDSESGIIQAPPTVKISELLKKYPVAAAYLEAEGYVQASTCEKSVAGQKALEKIINGEDYKSAIEEMHSWNAHRNPYWD